MFQIEDFRVGNKSLEEIVEDGYWNEMLGLVLALAAS
jgi:hypothetical protein